MFALFKKKNLVTFTMALLLSLPASATLLPVGVSVNGGITVLDNDTFTSNTIETNEVIGTVATPLSGTPTLNSGFTNIGDGINFSATATQTGISDYLIYNLDYLMSMTNTSDRDYSIRWVLNWRLNVDANGDAFTNSAITGPNGFYKEISSDTDLGNYDFAAESVIDGYGGPVPLDGQDFFDFDLLANNGSGTVEAGGAASVFGESFDSLSNFTSVLDFSFTIASITDVTSGGQGNPNPQPVPEPATILLFLFALAIISRRQSQQ